MAPVRGGPMRLLVSIAVAAACGAAACTVRAPLAHPAVAQAAAALGPHGVGFVDDAGAVAAAVEAPVPASRSCILPPELAAAAEGQSTLEVVPLAYLEGIELLVAAVNRVCDRGFAADGAESPAGAAARRIAERLVEGRDRAAAVAVVPAAEAREASFLCEHIAASRPALLAGAAQGWPAMEWTPARLRAAVGDEEIHVKISPNGWFEGVEPVAEWLQGRPDLLPDFVREHLAHPDLAVVRPASAMMTMSELVDGGPLRGNASFYAEYLNMRAYLPELLADVQAPRVVEALELDSTNLWMGGRTRGKLHMDPFDNVMCVLAGGHKEFLVVDPVGGNADLYEGHIREAQFGFRDGRFVRSPGGLQESTSMVMSPCDPEALGDHAPRCRAAMARAQRVRVGPGDCLFLPAFWWHEVSTEPAHDHDWVLAVNLWYTPFFDKEFPCADCALRVGKQYRGLAERCL